MKPDHTKTLLQCGFVSQTSSHNPICLTPTRVPANDVSQLVNGGWGCPSYITEGAALFSWGHAQPLDDQHAELQRVVSAAFGWRHAVLATRGGAYVLQLSRPSAPAHKITLGDQAVAAVAAGESHR